MCSKYSCLTIASLSSETCVPKHFAYHGLCLASSTSVPNYLVKPQLISDHCMYMSPGTLVLVAWWLASLAFNIMLPCLWPNLLCGLTILLVLPVIFYVVVTPMVDALLLLKHV